MKLLHINKKNIKGFFGWFNPANFMDTYQEWHAFVEGIADGFCPWQSRYDPNEELKQDIESEHHYYSAGTVIGFAAFIFAIAGAVRLVLEVVL